MNEENHEEMITALIEALKEITGKGRGSIFEDIMLLEAAKLQIIMAATAGMDPIGLKPRYGVVRRARTYPDA